MTEFENMRRDMPYSLPPQGLDTLCERIRRQTTARPSGKSRAPRRRLLAVTAVCAAALLAVGIFMFQRHRLPEPAPDIEQLISTASPEALRRAAAENYDDILYNQLL